MPSYSSHHLRVTRDDFCAIQIRTLICYLRSIELRVEPARLTHRGIGGLYESRHLRAREHLGQRSRSGDAAGRIAIALLRQKLHCGRYVDRYVLWSERTAS